MAEYVVFQDHAATVTGSLVQLKGGAVVTDAQYDVDALIAAGFKLVQINLTEAAVGGGQWPYRPMRPPWAPHTSSSSALILGSNECQAWYFGTSPKAYSDTDAFSVHWRVTGAQTGVTWSEKFIAKGLVSAPGNQNLTIVGWVSSLLAATGLELTVIQLAAGQSIAKGDDLFFGFAKLSTGSPSVRSTTLGDDLQVGWVLNAGAQRPSSIVGVPTAFTVAATSKDLPLFAVWP